MGLPPSRKRPLRRRFKLQSLLAYVLVAVVVGLLVREFHGLDMDAVKASLASLRPRQIVGAGLTTFCAYGALAAYDLLAVTQTRLSMHPVRTSLTSFVCYAFNFNLGSVVGAVAMRFRLYGRFGAARGEVATIVLFCVVTGWLGYSAVAGAAFFFGAPDLPGRLQDLARPLGLLGLGVAGAYLAVCRWQRKSIRFKGWRFDLPPIHIAAAQLTVGSLFWMAVAATIYQLLPAPRDVTFVQVLTVYLVAAVAGLVTHIPAGLGVLEGTFVMFLVPTLPKADVLAAILAFRGIYYLAPLLIASVVYFAMEVSARRVGRTLTAEAG